MTTSQEAGISDSHAKQIFTLAVRAHKAGLLKEAQNAYTFLLALEPGHGEAMQLLAMLLHQSGEKDKALTLIQRALTLRPNDPNTLCAFAVIARENGKQAEAELALNKALTLAGDKAPVLNDLGLLLTETKQYERAERTFLQAIKINPKYPEAHKNLGVLYKNTQRPQKAKAQYLAALAIDPDYADAHNNLGVLCKEAGDLSAAETYYRRAIDLKPDFADAIWNLGLVLLTQGRYEEGWACYEARYHPKRTESSSPKPDLPCPQWQGEPLAGKRIVVWSEQGHGDLVQFSRYLPLLKEHGAAHLTVACPPPLVPLFQSIAEVDAFIVRRVEATEYDYWVFPLSLPHLFEKSLTRLPNTPPYLKASPDKIAHWQPKTQANGQKKIGLIWQGNKNHRNDEHRSIASLSTLAPLFSAPNTLFYSLQAETKENELAAYPITPLGHLIADFGDTAAIIHELDLIISVDTAVAHVAGALAKPCWILLPAYECDWRWLQNRSDSPWYPTVKLFRQTVPHHWEKCIDEIAQQLTTLAQPRQ